MDTDTTGEPMREPTIAELLDHAQTLVNLRKQIAKALRQHHFDPTRTGPGQETDHCACGLLIPDWAEHWADVATAIAQRDAVDKLATDLAEARTELQQQDAEIERLRAELAEWVAEEQHRAFTHCDQGVGHVTMAAFALKISEKVNAVAQRDEATRYANEQLRRAEEAEAWQARARKLAADQHLKDGLTGECTTTCRGCYLERFLAAVDPMVTSP